MFRKNRKRLNRRPNDNYILYPKGGEIRNESDK